MPIMYGKLGHTTKQKESTMEFRVIKTWAFGQILDFVGTFAECQAYCRGYCGSMYTYSLSIVDNSGTVCDVWQDR